ncbi:Hypothetical protein FKW44_017729, partial [Caligus rogercresseyi]
DGSTSYANLEETLQHRDLSYPGESSSLATITLPSSHDSSGLLSSELCGKKLNNKVHESFLDAGTEFHNMNCDYEP